MPPTPTRGSPRRNRHHHPADRGVKSAPATLGSRAAHLLGQAKAHSDKTIVAVRQWRGRGLEGLRLTVTAAPFG
ncbi:hypothetical protein [Streptomyces sp. DSM 15324]|uniref:hypothetical protein n=1 Tax=Streptomyces sp. DSM 15324 TaxID=1739111 RepID=UPI000A7AD7F1|nr:hypothetical protein [Streptomyces sp. DSM 15324]